MSHFTVWKTNIGGLNKQLLVNAVTFFAKQIGAEVITSTKAFDRSMQRFDVGIKMEGMPNGIGFSVDADGKAQIHGDSWGQEEQFDKIRSMMESGQITNSYRIACNASNNRKTVRMQVQMEQKQILMEVC